MMVELLITQYDAVDLTHIPANPQAVAGYVGGQWPDYSVLVERFPNALHKSIAIAADEDADILDVERGDARIDEAVGWFKRQIANGHQRPGFYADQSDMEELIGVLQKAGLKRSQYTLWVAKLSDVAPNPPFVFGADADQYSWFTPSGDALDYSICRESFWTKTPSPAAKNRVNYSKFHQGEFDIHKEKLNEVNTVKNYDRLRSIEKPTAKEKTELAITKVRLLWLAERVDFVAHHPLNKKKKPTWKDFHRGWRYQQLMHRAQGQRFI
jgi:hypothetical protein